ncbi:unnamed protein product [Bemisia tabaci]|uniref:Sulfotransferase domain-containing protein n=1 Tax=Bemisia tabaci TaxID=7038 RepID=A0A9P0F4C7_BEMTA|nr:PREDICTED: estrogen sulfotransferase-like [Bemisia tabaci]CAH0389180.1 unnamed protein product [Bemisia tabaci]
MEPISVEPLDDELSARIRGGCRPGLMPAAGIKVQPSGCCLPNEYQLYAERLRTFHVRHDDIWCISYPKCGTTWTQEMVWLLENNLDFETAKDKLLLERVPFFEAVSLVTQDFLVKDENEKDIFGDTIAFTHEQPSPRVIKTHLPARLLPLEIWTRKPKLIYVTRDPKDVAISYYHHHRLWNGYSGSYEDFIEGFLQDKLVYSPFWEHIAGYVKLSHLPNVLINSYEDMTNDLAGVIRRTAAFLGREYTESEVARLAEHLKFPSMKKNAAVNGEDFIVDLKEKHGMCKEDPDLSFVRKGKSGGFREAMPQHLIDRFDEWSRTKKIELGIQDLNLSQLT